MTTACMEKFVINDGRMTFFIKKNDAKFFCSLLKKFCSLLDESLQTCFFRYQFSSIIKPITCELMKDSRAFIGES